MRTAGIYNFLLESTILASIAILLMLLVRRLFRRQLGSRAICFAWLLVAIRLLCPLALPNPIIHEIQTPYNFDQAHIRPIAGQIRVRFNDAVNQVNLRALNSGISAGKTFVEVNDQPIVKLTNRLNHDLYYGRLAHTVLYVYLAGAAGAAGWFVYANIRFRRQLKKNRIEPLSGGLLAKYQALCAELHVHPLPVYLTDPLPGACLVGVTRPFIALPLSAAPEDAEQMLLHELWHYKTRDPWWTLLQLLCCVVHWFNPLVWLAAHLSRVDREMKCDEHAAGGMDEENKRRYAAVLVKSAARRALPDLPVLATGMSMTGKNLKLRVGALLQGGKRLLAASVIFAVTASLLLVCAFATADPAAPKAGTFAYNVDEHVNMTRLSPETYQVAALPALSIGSADAALERVMTVLKSSYMRMDLAEGTWTAQKNPVPTVDGGEREGFTVDGEVNGRNIMSYVRPDGTLSFVNVDFPDDWTWDNETRLPMDRVPDFDQLAAYALEAAEYMAPGIQEKLEGMYFLWEAGPGDKDDTRLVYFIFRVPGETDWEMALEYTPERKVWSFGQGNG